MVEWTMKRNLVLASVGALVIGALASLSAVAQTCADPYRWQPPPEPAQPALGGTTCSGDTTASGYCGGNFDAPGPAFVILSTFTSNRTATRLSLTGGGAGFDPVVYFSPASSPCGSNAACGATTDTGTPIDLSGAGDVPDGDWFIIVTAASIDGAGACGQFALQANGSFPVALQSFSVD
jgi:hypothetical protein